MLVMAHTFAWIHIHDKLLTRQFCVYQPRAMQCNTYKTHCQSSFQSEFLFMKLSTRWQGLKTILGYFHMINIFQLYQIHWQGILAICFSCIISLSLDPIGYKYFSEVVNFHPFQMQKQYPREDFRLWSNQYLVVSM